jgi:hypothetical protein
MKEDSRSVDLYNKTVDGKHSLDVTDVPGSQFEPTLK